MMYLYMHTMQESVLNGYLEPCGQVEGFTIEVAANGSFCPPHLVLPVNIIVWMIIMKERHPISGKEYQGSYTILSPL